MAMDWQLILVVLIVAAAVLYLGRQSWRMWLGKKAGCGSCSCSKPGATAQGNGKVTVIPVSQLTVRRQGLELPRQDRTTDR